MRVAIVGCGLIGGKRAKSIAALGHTVACTADTVLDRAADRVEHERADEGIDERLRLDGRPELVQEHPDALPPQRGETLEVASEMRPGAVVARLGG